MMSTYVNRLYMASGGATSIACGTVDLYTFMKKIVYTYIYIFENFENSVKFSLIYVNYGLISLTKFLALSLYMADVF